MVAGSSYQLDNVAFNGRLDTHMAEPSAGCRIWAAGGVRSTHTFVDTAGVFFGTDRIRQDVDLVTVRVNYRWGGPVIAKY